jgi:peptidoglycan/LPS O-acetylase OafA/YrhL
LDTRNFLQKTLGFFNYKLSVIGAAGMAIIVYYINSSHGYLPAATAAMKQFFYTFFIGGLILRFLEFLLKKLAQNLQGILLAILLTSLSTILLIYFVHSLKGTPEPFYSTIPTIILAPFGFTCVTFQKGYFKREDLDLKKAA